MEHPLDGDVRLRCPLFLFSGETVGELEALLRDLRGGGYTPLSLRELFRCRRGLRSWPPRPCAVLLREVPFAMLQGVLPLLERWETPVSLFCRAPYGETEAEALRTSRWMHFYGEADGMEDPASLLPDGRDAHIAAFCEMPDTRTVAFLREKRIWMAVTARVPIGNAPGGVDLLYALPVRRGNRLPELLAFWHRSLTMQTMHPEEPQEQPFFGCRPRSASILLPLAAHVPTTELPLAAYLSILGDTPFRMEQVLASTDWNPVFDPSDSSYRLCPSWDALAEEPLTEVTAEGLLRSLQEGSYPFLRPQASLPGGLLLFGYDGERDLFLGMTASECCEYGRANFRPHTLEEHCRTGAVMRLTPVFSKLSVSSGEAKDWADEVREDFPAEEVVRCGWGASVAFANRVSGGASVSAASLRAFLEERMFSAFRLRYFCERENLYTEPSDKYRALLEKEGRPLLQTLQGREAPEKGTLPQTGSLLQRMLNAEELCRRAFSEGLEHMQALRTFQKEKRTK